MSDMFDDLGDTPEQGSGMGADGDSGAEGGMADMTPAPPARLSRKPARRKAAKKKPARKAKKTARKKPAKKTGKKKTKGGARKRSRKARRR